MSTQGYRSMAVSSEGKYLAAGDFDGNLHIYDLKSSDYTYIEVNLSIDIYLQNHFLKKQSI